MILRTSVFIGLPLLLLLLSSCGGLVAGDKDNPPETTSSIPSSSESAPWDPNAPAPDVAEDGEWGTWQLLSVEDSVTGKRQYDPPFIEIDLQPDGTAFLWTCVAASTGNGERCPAPFRQTCHKGTISISGTTWRVQLNDRAGQSVVGRGDVKDEPSGDIAIDGTGILPARAHYRRVGAATREGCLP